jgi:protein-S-isoprenylcysteine O-methyltransferase Ste14
MILMRLVRSFRRRQIGWKVSWPVLKKNPMDTALLLLCMLAWATGLVVYFGFPQTISRFNLPLAAWIRWGGFALGLCGVALLGWADHTLGENLSISLRVRPDHTLIANGPYRRIRHPIYAAGLLFSAGISLLAANALFAACFLGSIIPFYVARIRKEERMMLTEFGEAYRQYMQRTGRILPRLRQTAEMPLDSDRVHS